MLEHQLKQLIWMIPFRRLLDFDREPEKDYAHFRKIIVRLLTTL